jgi:hypothetical protein
MTGRWDGVVKNRSCYKGNRDCRDGIREVADVHLLFKLIYYPAIHWLGQKDAESGSRAQAGLYDCR